MSKYYSQIQFLCGFVIFWSFVSVMGSLAQSDTDNCSNDYPIGYFFHTKLFCPIEEAQDEHRR